MKVCEVCEATFTRPYRLGAALWAARRYCSQACSIAARTSADRPCDVEGCANLARGAMTLCNMHRQRARKHGDPTHERWPDKLTRIMRSIRKGDCWEWTGSLFQGTGYAQVWADGTTRLGHRVVYELLVGPIPKGLELDHLCRVRSCVNPAHLEPVTHKVNMERGYAAVMLERRRSKS